MADHDRTASLMTPSKLAQARPKAAVSPAAWLDQMAADAGHPHVRRLGELRLDAQAQARRRDFSGLATALERLAQVLPLLDFSLLQARSWWARTTGKGRGAGADFAGQFDAIDQAAQAVASQAQAIQKAQQEQHGAAELAWVEFEVEYRAIDKIIEQGTRWLHDMRSQLKARQAAAADEASLQQVKDDAARCEILVARLKALRAVSSAAQQAHQQAQAAAARRTAMLQLLQQPLASGARAWRARLAPLAAAARDGDSPALSLEAPQEAHGALRRCALQAVADCAQLLGQEKAMAESLDAFGAQLAAA